MSQQTSASNYDLYKVFLYVARYKSLTRAAKELNVSQPAISQSMKQLEANLSVKLTRRTGHGIRLTQEGELLYPYIEKGCNAFSTGEKALEKYLKELSDREEEAKKEHSRPVKDCFVTGTQYSHFTGQKLPYKILEHLPVILSKNDATRKNIDGFLKDNDIALKQVSEYDSYKEVMEHIIRNDGIGALPFDFAKGEIDAGNLYILDFEKAIPERYEEI